MLENIKKKSKLGLLSLFSIFSLSSLLMILSCFIFLLLAYFNIVDKNGKLAHIANEILFNQTGIPIEELEELEGVKHKN